MDQTVRMPFSDVTSISRTASSGYEISEIDITVANFTTNTKIKVVAPLYEYWRIVNLEIDAFMDTVGVPIWTGAAAGAVGFSLGIGFIPSDNADFGVATNFDDLMQFPNSSIGPSSKRLRLRLGPKDLYKSTPTKWYHTATTGSPPVADSSVGTVTYITRSLGGLAAQNVASYVTIRGEVEFKAPLIGGAATRKSSSLLYRTLVVREPETERKSVPPEWIQAVTIVQPADNLEQPSADDAQNATASHRHQSHPDQPAFAAEDLEDRASASWVTVTGARASDLRGALANTGQGRRLEVRR